MVSRYALNEIAAELPEDRRVVGCKWIFKKKSGLSSTEAIKYKARLVAKDYNEIFSMTVKHTSICVLQALTTTMDMELKQLDVKTTFLHGKLEEEILMKQLEGFGWGNFPLLILCYNNCKKIHYP